MIYLTHMSNSTHCCNIWTATFHLLMSKLRLGRVCTFATAAGSWRFCLDPSAGSWWSCYPHIWTALATHSLHHRMPLGGKRPMEMHSHLVVCAQGLRDMAVVWKRVCCSGANQRVTIGVPLSLTPNYSGSFCELVIAQSSVAQIMGGTFNPAPAPLPLPLKGSKLCLARNFPSSISLSSRANGVHDNENIFITVGVSVNRAEARERTITVLLRPCSTQRPTTTNPYGTSGPRHPIRTSI